LIEIIILRRRKFQMALRGFCIWTLYILTLQYGLQINVETLDFQRARAIFSRAYIATISHIWMPCLQFVKYAETVSTLGQIHVFLDPNRADELW